MKTRFYKYQALGNDMLVLDPATFDLPLTPAACRLLCNRHFGLGADGICYGPLPGPAHPRRMRFINPDGTEAEKSGNGLRIFARYLWDRGYVSTADFDIFINGELVRVRLREKTGRTFSVDMGQLSFYSSEIPVSGQPREVVEEPLEINGTAWTITAVGIGNPHCVIFTGEVTAALARQVGPAVEQAACFPNRVNVQFAQALETHTLQIEIWERGAGYTLASGTSSCAAAGAAIRTGRCRSPVQVRMAGGVAVVAVDDTWQATLTGEVEAVATGYLAGDLLARLANDRGSV
jgi:diaminopimelate epimerase